MAGENQIEKAVAYPTGTRSERKRRAIVEAAAEVFLATGYLGTSMDEIAARSEVSKQTVYKHFASKEALFVEIITSMVGTADTRVHTPLPEITTRAALEAYLHDYAQRLLTVVLTPRLMQLRRLVIAEAPRFPELAQVLYEQGPGRAANVMAQAFTQMRERGLLQFDDAMMASTQFNWLILGEPINRVMMLGDPAIPSAADLRRQAEAGIRTFLAAYLHPDQR